MGNSIENIQTDVRVERDNTNLNLIASIKVTFSSKKPCVRFDENQWAKVYFKLPFVHCIRDMQVFHK